MTERAPLEPVSFESVRWHCDPERFSFEDTSEVAPLEGIIGHARALRALKVGLELNAPGFNVFVCGLIGSGRAATLQAHLRKVRPFCPLSQDRAYASRFNDPFRPRLLVFARAQAAQFSRELDHLLIVFLHELPGLFASDTFQRLLGELKAGHQARKDAARHGFDQALAAEGFSLVEVRSADGVEGVLRVRVSELPEPVTEEQLQVALDQGTIDAERGRRLHAAFVKHREALAQMVSAWRSDELEFLRGIEGARSSICRPLVTELVDGLKKRFKGQGVSEFLTELGSSLLENAVGLAELASSRRELPELMTPDLAQALYRYRVHVILDNTNREGCPVIVESQPTFTNLFGGVERPPLGEEPLDDFHSLRAGSLLEADGGFLVVNAQDVLREPGVWPRLKTSLRERVYEIPEADPENRRTTILKPEAIPINVKVLMVGSFESFYTYLEVDPEFQHIFKVRVDFDRDLPVTTELVERQIPALVSKICAEEALLPCDRGAVAILVERAVRWAGRQDRLATRFTRLADLLREANYWAGVRGARRVERPDVIEAIEARDDRAALPEETARRHLIEGNILIDLEGSAVGQVNSLVVRAIGEDSFGQPVRITARVGMGIEGVINIEREVGLSGETHDKGIQILTGYLRGQYARACPLSLAASVCFEQSYAGVDGDSASSTELYAILSAIAEAPVRQDIAVTGSVNQRGEIQPVGGLNEKIEGFYRVVRELGFPGQPGVLIPRMGLRELMLGTEVVEAVRNHKFRIYAIRHVDEGLELLTGRPAGVRRPDGSFPPQCLHHQIELRLSELAEGLARFRATGL